MPGGQRAMGRDIAHQPKAAGEDFSHQWNAGATQIDEIDGPPARGGQGVDQPQFVLGRQGAAEVDGDIEIAVRTRVAARYRAKHEGEAWFAGGVAGIDQGGFDRGREHGGEDSAVAGAALAAFTAPT